MARNTSNWTALAARRAYELNRELAFKIAAFIGSAEKRTTPIPGLTLHQRTAPTVACHVTYEPCIMLVPQGRKQVQIGSRTLTHDWSRFLLVSIDMPAVTRVSEASPDTPCLAASLKVDLAVVREFLSHEEFQGRDATPGGPALSTPRVTPEFLDAWRRLLDLLTRPEDIPFLSGLIEREILYRILRGPEGARLRAIATLSDPSHRAAKAIAWIRANYSRRLPVKELAEVAGMAVTTLHHHFRALTGLSPLQYQKRIRLQAARARMLAGDVDAATVAFEVGYESASQFSREYRRLFGEPPVRDIRRLRTPAARQSELARIA